MAKYYENTTIFHYNWEQVLQGFWKRYPNPYSSHVLSEDTITREVKNDGKLYSKRIITKTNRVPKWGERFFNAKFVCVIEESVVDPHSKTLVTYTRNIGFNKIMSVVEKVIYRSSIDGKTVAMRSAWIDSQVFGFANVLRAFGCERFKKNCQKTVMGFNHVLATLFPMHSSTTTTSLNKENVTQKIKEAAKSASERAKEQIYQVYSVKN